MSVLDLLEKPKPQQITESGSDDMTEYLILSHPKLQLRLNTIQESYDTVWAVLQQQLQDLTVETPQKLDSIITFLQQEHTVIREMLDTLNSILQHQIQASANIELERDVLERLKTELT
jgi:hypothetical protein